MVDEDKNNCDIPLDDPMDATGKAVLGKNSLMGMLIHAEVILTQRGKLKS